MRLTRQLLVLTRRGVLTPGRPDRVLAQLVSLLAWGAGIAGEVRQAAARSPDAIAVIDERRGAVSYAALLASSERAARALLAHGVSVGERIGVLARNHLGLVELLAGASAAGIDVVLLNTGLAASQVAEVAEREGVRLVVHDEEFSGLVEGVTVPCLGEEAFLNDMLAVPASQEVGPGLAPPPSAGRVVVLTSGTTGPPKGARRPHPRSLTGLASLLDRIPLHPRETVLLSAPIFHTWGFGALQLSLALRDTIVLQRRFDPEEALSALAEHRCQGLFAVPVMLQRLLRHRPEDGSVDLPALRVVAVSGSSLPAGLAGRFMATFGPVLYNVYGSTEVSWAAIADPDDLRAAPTCSGRPPQGTRIAIVGDDDREVAAGRVGRVFVGNVMLFSGYTHGHEGERWHGLVDTGDLGHLEGGRLHLDGRGDDMIVSGGENVHPAELEIAIGGLPEVHDVSVFGVPDEEFGERLVACIVLRHGTHLVPDEVTERVRPLVSRQALPREVHLLDELPRNATGKVLVNELRATLSREPGHPADDH